MKKAEKIRVLIADDNINFQKKLAELIENESDMEVSAFASNGEEAIKNIIEKQPDIAIIDLLMPLKDGFGVLEELRDRNIQSTVCIVISAIGLDSIANKAISLGAQYYIIKPYRNEFLLGRIRQVFEEKQCSEYLERFQELREEKMESFSGPITMEKKSPEQKISQLLSSMNVSASIKGYFYLRNAILMVCDNEDAIVGITKRMYPELAKQYHTTANKVERAIRHAIESAWKKGAYKVYSEIIGVECLDRPTNGQFIGAIGEYLRLAKEL